MSAGETKYLIDHNGNRIVTASGDQIVVQLRVPIPKRPPKRRAGTIAINS